MTTLGFTHDFTLVLQVGNKGPALNRLKGNSLLVWMLGDMRTLLCVPKSAVCLTVVHPKWIWRSHFARV